MADIRRQGYEEDQERERLRSCCQSAKRCIRKSGHFQPWNSIPGVHSYRQQYFPRYGVGACPACWISRGGHSRTWWAILTALRRTFIDSIYCEPDHRADWFSWCLLAGFHGFEHKEITRKGLEIHQPSLRSGTRYINTECTFCNLVLSALKILIGGRAIPTPAGKFSAFHSQE